jgi:hypothetical protein
MERIYDAMGTKITSAVLDKTGITEADIKITYYSFVLDRIYIKTWKNKTYVLNMEDLC